MENLKGRVCLGDVAGRVIKMDLTYIGCESVDWIYLAVSKFMIFLYSNEPSDSMKGREFLM
jgi:hypothetical protein